MRYRIKEGIDKNNKRTGHFRILEGEKLIAISYKKELAEKIVEKLNGSDLI